MKLFPKSYLLLLLLFLVMPLPKAMAENQMPSIEDLIALDGEVEVDSQAKGFFEKAILKYEANDMEGAFHYGKLAYRKDQRILLLNDNGMLEGMEVYLRKETKSSPDDVFAFYKLAKMLALRNKIDEAKTALNSIIKIDPDSDLGKKATIILANAPSNTSSQDKKANSYDKEYAKLNAESTELQRKNSKINKHINEEYHLKKQQAELNSAQDKRLAELEEENRMSNLYSTLFWANPTNAWAMNNNYTRPTAGKIRQYPDYYKAKGAQYKAKVEYRRSFNTAPSGNRPVQLPAARR